MSISGIEINIPAAMRVAVTDDALTADLSDGRSISVPIVWFPRLLHATPEERSHWTLVGDGVGVHWPDIDEDISVESLIAGRMSGERPESLERWKKSR
jgi:hypothetical protein